MASKTKFFLGFIMFITYFSFPLIIAYLMKGSFFDWAPGTDGDWLGFWSGYIGSGISVLLAIIIVKYETKETKEDSIKLHKIQKDLTRTISNMIDEQKRMYYDHEIREFILHEPSFETFLFIAKQLKKDASSERFETVHLQVLELTNKLLASEKKFFLTYKTHCPVFIIDLVDQLLNEIDCLNSMIGIINESVNATEKRGFQAEDKADILYAAEEIDEHIGKLKSIFNNIGVNLNNM